MTLRFLGTGTSFGIPVVGCDCATCTSSDPRDRRTRHGAVLEGDDGRRILIDTPPELRLQLLDAGIDRIDAVWFTHDHADHVHGIDDLRAFTARARRPLAAFAGPDCARALRTRFGYIFSDADVPKGTTRPEIHLHLLDAGEPIRIAGIRMTPIVVPHGRRRVFGFRVGDLGYITDAGQVPDGARAALDGVRTLVLNALWFGKPHPTHMTVEDAIRTAQAIGAERTYLTHLTHRVRHADLLDALPRGIEPAYDGLALEF